MHWSKMYTNPSLVLDELSPEATAIIVLVNDKGWRPLKMLLPHQITPSTFADIQNRYPTNDGIGILGFIHTDILEVPEKILVDENPVLLQRRFEENGNQMDYRGYRITLLTLQYAQREEFQVAPVTNLGAKVDWGFSTLRGAMRWIDKEIE